MNIKGFYTISLFILGCLIFPTPLCNIITFADEPEKFHGVSEAVAKPKIMVIVRAVETSFSIFHRETDVSISVENIIEAELKRNNFTLISPLQPAIQQLEDAYAKGDNTETGRILRDAGVDVIIFGEVLRAFVDTRRIGGGNYRFFSNNVRFKAITADSGVVIYSGAKDKPPTAESYTEPLKDAAIELTKEFVKAIAQAVPVERLLIIGTSFEQVVNFQKAINGLKGVKAVQRRGFQDDAGVLEVSYDGSTDDFLNLINSIEGFKTKVLSVQGNEIVLSLEK